MYGPDMAGAGAVASPVHERDDELREQLSTELHQAADRATFHQREAERWERIGRAAGAALVQLDSIAPYREVTAEQLVDKSRPSKVHPQAGEIARKLAHNEQQSVG